jgi:hypothetical protein
MIDFWHKKEFESKTLIVSASFFSRKYFENHSIDPWFQNPMLQEKDPPF